MSQNQRKKIYINGKFLAQKLSGVQRYAIEIVKAMDKLLADKNYEVILLTPKVTMRQLKLKHVTITACGYLQGTLWEQLELPFYAKGGALVNLCNCAPLLKENQMVTIHDAAVMAVPAAYGFFYRCWHHFMGYVLGKCLPLIITDSKFSRQELQKYLHIPVEKIHVVYLGADHMESIEPDESIIAKLGLKERKYVLAVSSQSIHKNFQLVLQAASLMTETTFVIVGQSNSSVFKNASLVMASDNVIFTGYIDDGKLAALYKHACCFVYPSLYEGFGLPPLEAMAFGTPVISSQTASLPEVLGEGVLYIDPYRIEDMAEAIAKMISNRALRDRLMEKGREQYRQYDWDNTAQKIMERMVGLIC